MIFATVGTSTFAFDRLLRGVDELGLADELVVQFGACTYVPRASVARDFMSYSEVMENMRRARAVVCHGGVGSILTALNVGRIPIVVPRRRRFDEAVDDHQVDLVARLAGVGLVTFVDDAGQLSRHITRTCDGPVPAHATSLLASAVGEYVESVLGPAAPR